MRNEAGFTLLELLVAMASVIILTAIALPEFREYRAYAYDIQARMDLRNIAIGEEAYYLHEDTYLSCQNDSRISLPGIVRISEGTQLSVTATDTSFTGQSSHERGTGTSFLWDSTQGGFLD